MSTTNSKLTRVADNIRILSAAISISLSEIVIIFAIFKLS